MIDGHQQPRALQRARLDTLTRLDAFDRADGAEDGRKAGVEKLLELRRRPGLEPLRAVALDDVPVGVDEAGHQRPPLRIDPLGARDRRGRAGGHRDDLAVAHHHGAALDHAAFAVDDPRVDDGQVLGGRVVCPGQQREHAECEDDWFHNL